MIVVWFYFPRLPFISFMRRAHDLSVSLAVDVLHDAAFRGQRGERGLSLGHVTLQDVLERGARHGR